MAKAPRGSAHSRKLDYILRRRAHEAFDMPRPSFKRRLALFEVLVPVVNPGDTRDGPAAMVQNLVNDMMGNAEAR
jgi:hypothetical protein